MREVEQTIYKIKRIRDGQGRISESKGDVNKVKLFGKV